MSNKTSEKCRLSKLEHELLYQSFRFESMVEFREYLLALIGKIKQDNFDDSLCDELKKTFLREIKKYKAESVNKYKESLAAREQFDELCGEGSKESDLPKSILDLSSLAVDSISETEETEKCYLKKLYLCEEFDKFIKKYSKKLDAAESESQKSFLNELLDVLSSQLPEEEQEKDRLYRVFKEKETKAFEEIAELMDELEMFSRKQPEK